MPSPATSSSEAPASCSQSSPSALTMPLAPGASPTSSPAFASSSIGSCLTPTPPPAPPFLRRFFFLSYSLSSSSESVSPACVLNRSASSESDRASSSRSPPFPPFNPAAFSSHCDVDVVCRPLASSLSSASSREMTRRLATGLKLYHCSIGMAHTSVVFACIMRRKKLPSEPDSREPLNCTRPPFLLSLTSWRLGSRPALVVMSLRWRQSCHSTAVARPDLNFGGFSPLNRPTTYLRTGANARTA
mmetsp:Transcript_3928/g.10642  ORF Transcript_3928/g.10642 Transcript_3928/m.10642 type:complete len:245 (+) Transcript_3928:359-1093(+)